MLRDIIEIDEALCNGCGDCVPACHEGALQIIDNKARLISDLMCDGLGACLGECPTGAMKVIQREAVPYDERQVMENIIKGGDKVIKAHLEHMLEHNELEYYNIALQVLNEQSIKIPSLDKNKKASACPGQKQQNLDAESNIEAKDKTQKMQSNDTTSQLSHWPIQLHLINPTSQEFNNIDLLLASDCSAFAAGDFHSRYLKGKKLVIACPKLDSNQQTYIEKLTILIRYSRLKSLTIVRMDVPCCGGLSKLVQTASQQTRKSIPIHTITLNKYGQEV
ncbi:ATP-binding protein [Psychromonas sp. KJ10-10]|uniref:ATP-binding protein n=1 Tax=Psychromonas sp. KJ10-10 TaxID=3391823 RepID=UPI0039B42AF4